MLLAALLVTPLLSGCGLSFGGLSPTDCMTRVMYFESNRSSAEGMLAVGTVVMNRVNDRAFPHSVCGVVGQPNQFAAGVLWNKMRGTVSNFVRGAMMMKRRESSHGYREGTFGPVAGWARCA